MIIYSEWTELKAQITVTSNKTTSVVSDVVKLMAAIELTTFCVLFVLMHYSVKEKAAIYASSLTEKYQVAENVRSISLVLAMVITHFYCFMPAPVAFPIYYWIDAEVHLNDYVIFVESFGTTILYSVLLPIVLFWRHKRLHANIRQSIGVYETDRCMIVKKSRAKRPISEHAKRFELLDTMWNE